MPRGDQISRQWQILQILEARRMGVSVPELASELESNVRTIYRDMEALEHAGFPLYSEKEEGAERWLFVEGYRSKMPIPFTLTELMALSIAHDHLKAFEGTIFSESLRSAFEKVRSMLSPESHAFIDGLAKTFKVGLHGRKDYRGQRETVDVINTALLEHHTIEMRYKSSRGEVLDRRVDPYHVWFMGGSIYVIGFCHERKQQRLFVLDRIEKANLTEHKFKIPEDFSIEEFTRGRFRVMDGDPIPVKIHFDKDVAYYVKERKWHPTQEIIENSDGSIDLSMTVEGTAEMKSWVMSFGSHAEVVEPGDLRFVIAGELKDAVKKYEKNKTVGHL
ncbi:MAG: transcriptional regulator [Pseudomonadota bacterium]